MKYADLFFDLRGTLVDIHAEADPARFPGNTYDGHYEFEGYDWQKLSELLCEM